MLTPDAETVFDLILSGGILFDGLGNLPVQTDLGIVGTRIAVIGHLAHASASRRIDVSGFYVAPGFIDIHTHSDISVLFTPSMNSSLAQGVTAEVAGNCGFSMGLIQPSDTFAVEQGILTRNGATLNWEGLPGFYRRIEENGIAINIATLAGHNTLRKRAMGNVNRAPDARELATMQRDLEEALQAGAVGFSTGLEYVPGMYAQLPELVALARVAAQAGGFYATHLRDEGDFLEESVQEAIAVAEAAGLPLQLSHHKAERPRNWGKVVNTLAMVDAAQARGLDIFLDQYPYTAYQTALAVIALPDWAVGSSPAALNEQLADHEYRARVRAAMEEINWDAVEIASCASRREYQGFTVSTLARASGKDPRDFVLDLLAESDTFVAAAHFAMSDADVERVLSDPRVMIGSDAVALDPNGPGAADRPHPRSYGTFARIFDRYVKQKGLLTWEEAIRRMTSLPAQRLGWTERGRLAPGAFADIVVFDPDTIVDTATFASPHQLATGVRLVFVAGVLAFADGAPTGARPGRVLHRH